MPKWNGTLSRLNCQMRMIAILGVAALSRCECDRSFDFYVQIFYNLLNVES